MARRLVWTQQPTRTRAGEAISPPPRLEIRAGDAVDPRVLDGEVTARIMSGPPGALLRGTTRVRAPGGVATFENLRPSIPGDYVLAAECDEASLEIIPRPSIYRYVGTFPGVEEGQPVDILGTQATQGQVVGIGPGWIEVQDALNGALSQQEAVSALLPMNIDRVLQNPTHVNGAPAAWHFAADSVGIDPEGSLGFWEARGGSLVEGLGRWPECVSGASLVSVDSPLGGGRGVTAASGRAELQTPPEFAGSALLGPGNELTLAVLSSFKPWAFQQSEFRLMGEGGNQEFEFRCDGSTSSRRDHVRFRASASGGTVAIRFWVGRSVVPHWNLFCLSFAWSQDVLNYVLRINGQLPPGASSPDISLSSVARWTEPLEGFSHWVGQGGALAQVAFYPEAKSEEWMLEQARRCGVAP